MARGAIVLFVILGGMVAISGASLVFGYATGNLKLSNMLPSGSINSRQFHARFIESAKTSCARRMPEVLRSATAQQIESYCDCTATRSADLLTEDDVRYMLDHLGSAPQALAEKLSPVIAQCRSMAFARSE
jgi:hypothetical protein